MSERETAETPHDTSGDMHGADTQGVSEKSKPSLGARHEGSAFGNGMSMAVKIASVCGPGSYLDVGCGTGRLVGELLKIGIDAHGVDESGAAIARCQMQFPDRFQQASILSIPAADSQYNTVVSINCLEHLGQADVPRVLQELYRVAGRYLFLQIAVVEHGENKPLLTVANRERWEHWCWEAGFRKHPMYYSINDYADLNDDGREISIVLEKIPYTTLSAFPLSALADERDLHMDMLRETGERSDAHIIRYKWATEYVRPGDAVLDAACGLGYGSYVLRHNSEAKTVTGIDGSEYAVNYARENFATMDPHLNFHCGYLPEYLQKFPSGSFDTIISFETLEHIADPKAVMEEFYRLLSPGGRVVVSVPNDWSDETGNDPNPYHLHVYTLDRLKNELAANFLVEDTYQQIASGCKIRELGNTWGRMPRLLRKVDINAAIPPDSEWWLMVGMKNPVGHDLPYRETVYGYTSPPKELLEFERDYRNPWLVRSMLEFHFRAKSPTVLSEVARQVIQDPQNSGTPDRAAALAIVGYQALSQADFECESIEKIISDLKEFTKLEPASAHLLRWRVSHGYLVAQLQKKIGLHSYAMETLDWVSAIDLEPFNPSLGTKIVDAAYEAGILAINQGMEGQARVFWQRGIERAYALLQAPVEEFIGKPEYPQQFPTIVAVEFLDSAVRCIRALRWLAPEFKRPSGGLFSYAEQNWKSMLLERWNAMQSMESMIRQRDESVVAQGRLLGERWVAMQSMEEMIKLRDDAISGQGTLLEERWAALRSMDDMVMRRDQTIAEQGKMLEERWEAMRSMEEMIKQRDETVVGQGALLEERMAAMQAMEEMIKQRDGTIVGQSQLVEERWAAMQSMESMIKDRDATVVEQSRLIAESQAAMCSMEEAIKRSDAVIASQNSLLRENGKTIKTMEDSLAEQASKLVCQEELITAHNGQIQSIRFLLKRLAKILAVRVGVSRR